jgi:two-component system, sensor histidine kinase and response regulator
MVIQLGKELNELDPMISTYEVISKSYQLLNEWKKAFLYTDSANVLKDTIYNIENQRKISEIEAKQSTEVKEKEIEISALTMKHQRNAIVGISFSLLLMIIIALLIYRSLKIKKRINKWLEEEVNKRTRDLQEANTKLEEANRDLLALEESKAEFLRLISHEIRTPLNGITGFTTLLKEELQSSELSGTINHLNKSVLRLEKFSIAALLITELRNKKASLNYSRQPLEELIQRAINRNEDSFSDKKLTVISEGEKDIVAIQADTELMDICLDTVLDNAIKYCYPGGEIKIRNYKKENEVVCEISDNGRGFTKEAREHLFQLFAIGERHIDNNTGLSLALVKLIMDAHRGKAEAGNNDGPGAYVRLTFPSL